MSDDRPLLLWLAPFYPPDQGGGAEWTIHEVNRFLIRSRGVRVIVASASLETDEFEGVETRSVFDASGLRALVHEARLVCTQLGHMGLAGHLAATCGKPIIYFLHGTIGLACPYRPSNAAPQFIVYNSEWVRDHLEYPMTSIVARPPVDWRNYRVDTSRACTTLINVRKDKGSDVFFECARRMRGRRFLGSMGFEPPFPDLPQLPNVEYVPFLRDSREIYARTGVLLMPSSYESWGRAAVEAMASGIPVIAHPTPGLRESLGPAGIFCDRDRVDDWVAALERLDDPAAYAAASEASWRRALALDPAEDLERIGRMVDDCLSYRER